MKTGESKITTDHNTIKSWAEKRAGRPSVVKRTRAGGGGLLRFDFPGYRGKEGLEQISWDEFFRIFDERHLQFLYQEKTSQGKESRFAKFLRGSDSD